MVSVIITSFKTDLDNIIDNAMSQTFKDTEIIVLATDVDSDYPHLKEPNFNDWGHNKRKKGLSICNGDYITFWNADDEYSNDFIEKLMSLNTDIRYCNFNSHLFGGNDVNSTPRIGGISSGNFIVNTEISRKVGYNHNNYKADGQFIEDLIKGGATHSKIEEVLYWHK